MAARPEPLPPNKKLSRYNSYLRYSGLAVQLLATLAICGWLGHKLDQYLDNKYPVFLLIFGFLGFFALIYQVYRSIKKEQVLRFTLSILTISFLLVACILFVRHQGWLPHRPSFLYETLAVLILTTTIIFRYLYNVSKPSFFTQLYLGTIAIKLLAYCGYCLWMVLADRQAATLNVGFFLIAYFIFTGLEITFLFRRISGQNGPRQQSKNS